MAEMGAMGKRSRTRNPIARSGFGTILPGPLVFPVVPLSTAIGTSHFTEMARALESCR